MIREHFQKKEGFTAVEIIVASLIFVTTAASILSILSSLKKPSSKTERKVEAAYFGKSVLDELRAKVSAKTWGQAGTAPGVGTYTTTKTSASGLDYTVAYTISNSTASSRKVTLNVTWAEPF